LYLRAAAVAVAVACAVLNACEIAQKLLRSAKGLVTKDVYKDEEVKEMQTMQRKRQKNSVLSRPGKQIQLHKSWCRCCCCPASCNFCSVACLGVWVHL